MKPESYPSFCPVKSCRSFVLVVLLSILASPFAAQSQICVSGMDSCGGNNIFCGPFTLSRGIYRIPFVNGTGISISNDHMNHCPRGRIDMVATSGKIGGEYHIAAAADGWIRAIVDNNNIMCDCSVTSCSNNYIWMEHPNGEWTKYTHMKLNSVPASLSIGDWVTAGTYIGNEGNVGCAGGIHLHFEVAQPIDTNTLLFSSNGGYIDEDWAMNVVPVICDITGKVFEEGKSYSAADCGTLCTGSFVNFSGTIDFPEHVVQIAGNSIENGSVEMNNQGAALYQAENYIDFKEGFIAVAGSSMNAQIAGCNEMAEKDDPAGNSFPTGTLVTESLLVAVYPNPITAASYINLSLPNEQRLSMFISDISGRKIHEYEPADLLEGSHSFSLPHEKMPAGSYLLVVKGSAAAVAIKLVKL